MLSAQPVGEELLINDLVIRTQSIERSSSSVVATSVNRVIVFEGKGAVDGQGIYAEVLDPNGATLTGSFQVNATVRGDQHSPAVAARDTGNFVVVWAGRGIGDKQGVFLQRFDSVGNPLGDETLVNTTTGGQQKEPAVAMAEDGSLVVAWSGTGVGDVSGIFLCRFDPSGAPLTDELLVNTTTNDHQTSPSIAFDSVGNLVVAWQSRHQDGSDWGVYGQWFSSDASRIGAETLLTETTGASQTAPDVSTDPTGGVVVGWQSRNQDGDSWGVLAREFDTGGNPSSVELLLNDQTTGHQQDVAIAVAGDGQWIATWSTGVPDGSGWEVAARSFETDGTANSSVKVNSETGGINSGHQQTPAVGIAGDQALIAWSGAGADDRHGVFAQQYEVDVNDGIQQPPDITPVDNRDVEVGTPIQILVTATDPNFLDTLTFLLDTDNSPTDAVLEQIDNNSARILWTPPALALGQNIPFRVLIVDDGEPPLSDAEDFLLFVAESVEASVAVPTAADEAFASFA